MIQGTYADQLREDVAILKEMLEPLVSGKMHIGERNVGQPWLDKTEAQIHHLQKTIATYQFIIDRLEKGEQP